MGTDTSITHLQGRLRNEVPGPGYLHLGVASTDQFLAELFPWKRKPVQVKGFIHYEWILPQGQHDEAGDCTRNAYAALQLVARRYDRATMWDQLEAAALASIGPQRVGATEQQSGGSPWLPRNRKGWLVR
jgi:phage terminase large subunit GpA-like protein